MPDSILYSLVARGTTVLAEYRRGVCLMLSDSHHLCNSLTILLCSCSTVGGNANLVAHRILEKVAHEDKCAQRMPARRPCMAMLCADALLCTRSRVSYSQDRHLFHIVVHSGITFLCMADEVRTVLGTLCILCMAVSSPLAANELRRRSPSTHALRARDVLRSQRLEHCSATAGPGAPHTLRFP